MVAFYSISDSTWAQPLILSLFEKHLPFAASFYIETIKQPFLSYREAEEFVGWLCGLTMVN